MAELERLALEWAALVFQHRLTCGACQEAETRSWVPEAGCRAGRALVETARFTAELRRKAHAAAG